MRCGHRVNLLRLTWSSFEESRDDRPLPGYDTPPHVTSSYTTSLDATRLLIGEVELRQQRDQ
ncbi:hypothetical protein BI295_05530 [Mycobacterium avium subsp. hominissuis]|nr:hypothetical protein BI295_05530 [Mycobacterium avium subsp. hominissuis]